MKRKQPYRKNVHTLVSLLLLFVSFVFGNSVEGASRVYAAEQQSEKILTEDEAIRFAQKWLPISAGYTYKYGNYVEPGGEIETPYGAWYLYWSRADDDSIIYKIHPVTGKLLYYQNQISTTSALSNADRQPVARERADQFLAHVIPPEQRSKLTEPRGSIVKSDSSETYLFVYKRVENNIPFDSNWIGISVSGDAKILRFKRLWYEGELPDPSSIIPEAKAHELLQQNKEPTLIYRNKEETFRQVEPINQKFMLVYEYQRTDPQMVDAITGEMVNAKGEVTKPKQKIKSLKEMAPAQAQKAGKGDGGVFTRQQAEENALHFVQTAFPGQLVDLYRLDPQPKNFPTSSPLDMTRKPENQNQFWFTNWMELRESSMVIQEAGSAFNHYRQSYPSGEYVQSI
ncbi:YcdB/YcdC domain-containing protein [Brevibacillus nitrificans]|uniref:YcdB/YcdC domain-containing protein n=1 Tax=Brevibacillus nitrificans TaxID=651560 RepID=UPI00285D357C|nr:YcdB/YcdC domain-containing protein [Brevibacillus nitrificans]MDR7314596.1 hypothetical protein [Brevibacillus nitrificans]